MAKSKISIILALLDGSHVMGADGLRDYHTARRIRDVLKLGTRTADMMDKAAAIRGLLKNYRVQSMPTNAGIRIWRADTGQELFF